MERDAVILDIGAGRGVWVEKMVSLGYKVIGIDYVENIVEKANEKIQADGYSDRARFMVGDATKIKRIGLVMQQKSKGLGLNGAGCSSLARVHPSKSRTCWV